MKASIDAASVRSSGRYSIASRSAAPSAAAARPPVSSISPLKILAPSRANNRAVAFPIPEAPPVTITVWPCISMNGSPPGLPVQPLLVGEAGLLHHTRYSGVGTRARVSRMEHAYALQRVQHNLRQPVGRQIELPGGRAGVLPHDIVAAAIVEAKMAKRPRQARQMVAVERQNPVMMASLQFGQKDLEHVVRFSQTAQVAQQFVPLR